MENAAKYTQIKVTIDSGTAAAFKEACMASGVSMTSVLMNCMAVYGGMPEGKKAAVDLSTRRKRRNEVVSIIQRLTRVKDAEEHYRDNIPGNLQGSMTYERADSFITLLEEALDLLGSVE